MRRVVVLGAGVMGTAFCLPLSDRGMDVRLVGTHLDRELVSMMRQTRVHPRLKAEIGANITVFQDHEMSAAFDGSADLIVGGISTPGIDWAIDVLADHVSGTPPIVMLTKGIGPTADHVETLPAHMERSFAGKGFSHGPIGAIGGPCIAGELAVRRQTAAIIGFSDIELAKDWAQVISTPYYQLRFTDDLIGLEICAALKNFYAIGVSSPVGVAETQPALNGAACHNAVSSLFNQAILELARIVSASGGRTETAYGLAGMGDLHVTCQAGRNSRLGRMMGAGMRYRDAMAGPLKGETVEGTLVAAALVEPLKSLRMKSRVALDDLPLADAIIRAIKADAPIAVRAESLHQL